MAGSARQHNGVFTHQFFLYLLSSPKTSERENAVGGNALARDFRRGFSLISMLRAL